MRVIELITAPTDVPVSVADLREWLRIIGDDNDSALQSRILEAVDFFERTTRTRIMRAGLRLLLPGFPCGSIRLPAPPLGAVTQIAYLDSDSAAQVIDTDDYVVTGTWPAEITCLETWPDTAVRPDAVRISFTSGYATAAAVPRTVKSAVLSCAGHFHEQPSPVAIGTIVNAIPMTLESLLAQHTYAEVL